jgi:hypothetical protein
MMRVNKLIIAVGAVISSELLAGIQASSETDGRLDTTDTSHMLSL